MLGCAAVLSCLPAWMDSQGGVIKLPPGLYLPRSHRNKPFDPELTPHFVCGNEALHTGGRPVQVRMNGGLVSMQARRNQQVEIGSVMFSIAPARGNEPPTLVREQGGVTYVRVPPRGVASDSRSATAGLVWGNFASPSGDFIMQLYPYKAQGMAFTLCRHRTVDVATEEHKDIQSFTGQPSKLWADHAEGVVVDSTADYATTDVGRVSFVSGVQNMVVMEFSSGGRVEALDLVDAVDRPSSTRSVNMTALLQGAGCKLADGCYAGAVIGAEGVMAVSLRPGRRTASAQWWAGGGAVRADAPATWCTPVAAVDEAPVSVTGGGALTFGLERGSGTPPFVGDTGEETVIIMAICDGRAVWLENSSRHRVVAVLSPCDGAATTSIAAGTYKSTTAPARTLALSGNPLTAALDGNPSAPATDVSASSFNMAGLGGRVYMGIVGGGPSLLCPAPVGGPPCAFRACEPVNDNNSA